mmetsp:Transcript_46717/g.116424  ORF Transcript_46717/g.116424 Transcript_46717/m.116424 type:complete len:207 (-) Transcript_46717:51-671(-)
MCVDKTDRQRRWLGSRLSRTEGLTPVASCAHTQQLPWSGWYGRHTRLGLQCSLFVAPQPIDRSDPQPPHPPVCMQTRHIWPFTSHISRGRNHAQTVEDDLPLRVDECQRLAARTALGQTCPPVDRKVIRVGHRYQHLTRTRLEGLLVESDGLDHIGARLLPPQHLRAAPVRRTAHEGPHQQQGAVPERQQDRSMNPGGRCRGCCAR